MKTFYKLKLLCVALFLITGCKKQDIDLYKGTDSIYFPYKEGNDNMEFSYGYISAFVQDTVIQITVRTTGPIVDYDRPYSLHLGDSTTLNKTDYKILNPTFNIPAGKLNDVISIRINRTQAIKQDTLSLDLNLGDNEYFSNALNSVKVGSGEKERQRSLCRLVLKVDDIIGRPTFWSTAIELYLGKYSAKKFQLMIGMFELDPITITDAKFRPSPSLVIAWGRAMQSYLNQMTVAGNPIIDDDDQPMKMGTAAQ